MQRWPATLLLFLLPICTSAVSPLFIEYVIKGRTHDYYRHYYIYDADNTCRISLNIYHEHYPSREHAITFEMSVKNIGNQPIDIDKHLIMLTDTGYHYFNQPMFNATTLQPGDSTFIYNRFPGNSKMSFTDLLQAVAGKEFTFRIEQIKAGEKSLSYPELSILRVAK